MGLRAYRAKRDFERTCEPRGGAASATESHSFVSRLTRANGRAAATPRHVRGGIAMTEHCHAPVGGAVRSRCFLRAHAILRIEVFFGKGNEFRVARMIDRFNSDDDVHQLGVVMMNMLDQFCLCIGWSSDEDGASVRNRLGDRVKIVMIFRGVSAPDGVSFVMDVPDGVVRTQNKSFDVRRAEVEHPRLMVINPNDRMVVVLVHGEGSALACC
jgi:hypothetical protein